MFMTQKMLAVKDSIHDFIWNAKYVAKVLMFQAALILMILGVFYVMNFHVEVVKNVQVISPIVTEGAK